MATFVVDLFDPTTDSLYVRRSEAVLTVDGQVIAGSGLSTRTFEVPETGGTKLDLTIQVPAPVPRRGTAVPSPEAGHQRQTMGTPPILVVQQSWMIDTSGKLAAVGSNDGGAGIFHWRMRKMTAAAKDLAHVAVDLTFINVSPIVRKQTKNLETFERPHPTFGMDSGEFSPKDLHHGCDFQVYELTVGKPKAWCVVVPPALRAADELVGKRPRSNVPVLLFMRPSFPNYGSAIDTDFPANRLNRLTRDPPKWGPFFARNHGFRQPGEMHEADLEGEAPDWEQFSWTGFEGQLAASGKPVLFVLPMPNGSEFGAAAAPKLRDRLRSLLVAMLGDGVLPSRLLRKSPTVERLAVAGYSAGGLGMMTALKKNREDIDELYWFDPVLIPATAKRLAADEAEVVRKWFIARKDRMLIMFGGIFLMQFLALQKELLALDSRRAASVLVNPAEVAFYNERNGMYHASLTRPGQPEEMLDDVKNQASPKALSKETGVFIESFKAQTENTEAELVLTSVAGKKKESHVFRCSEVEASGVLSFDRFAKNKDGGADWSKVSAKLIERCNRNGFGLRHQWVVTGGAGLKTRFPYGTLDAKSDKPGVFEGMLSFCLKSSGFPDSDG